MRGGEIKGDCTRKEGEVQYSWSIGLAKKGGLHRCSEEGKEDGVDERVRFGNASLSAGDVRTAEECVRLTRAGEVKCGAKLKAGEG